MAKVKLFVFIILTFIISCDSRSHVRTYKLPKAQDNTATSSIVDKNSTNEKLKWDKPETWIHSEGSSMRLASFQVPYNDIRGDLSVIQLAGNGGGIAPNVNRWRRQLGLEPKSLSEIENSMVEKEGKMGTYSIIKIINSQNNTAFLATIIPFGNKTLFIKLSIDASAIGEVESDFENFSSSIHFSR